MAYIIFRFFCYSREFPPIVSLTESSFITAAQVAQVATCTYSSSLFFSSSSFFYYLLYFAIVGSKWKRCSHLNLSIPYYNFQLAQHFDGIFHGIQANNVAIIPAQVSYDKQQQQQQCDHNNSNENLNRPAGQLPRSWDKNATTDGETFSWRGEGMARRRGKKRGATLRDYIITSIISK